MFEWKLEENPSPDDVDETYVFAKKNCFYANGKTMLALTNEIKSRVQAPKETDVL